MKLDIVMPVHNEEEGILSVATEWANFLDFPFRFIFVEDGSTDRTLEQLSLIAKNWETTIISSPQRKGYSVAVVDGIRQSSSEMVLVIDSDGQCDPADFTDLLSQIKRHHFVSGIRSPRQDNWLRKTASFIFHMYWRILTRIRMKDPSCPYVLGRGELFRLLAQDQPCLDYGYWWEFHFRRNYNNFTVQEVPVSHRRRNSGATQIYLPTKILLLGMQEALRMWRMVVKRP